MMPVNQPEMVRRTSAELERNESNSPGLLSYLHRSLDGNSDTYGQWESKEAFEAILKQPGFNPEQTVLEGLARNEFHLYNVVHTCRSIIGSRVFSPVVLPKLLVR